MSIYEAMICGKGEKPDGRHSENCRKHSNVIWFYKKTEQFR